MSDEYPDPRGGSRIGQQGEDQNLDTERSVAQLSPTGDARVDDAVARLNRLKGRPADEHVAVLEEVHGRLRDILGELDEDPAGSAGSSDREPS
jgi:hypothetical protein